MQASLDKTKERFSLDAHSASSPGVVMEWEDVENFLTAYQEKGRTQGTVQKYRFALKLLYDVLPDDKRIYRDTFPYLQAEMLEKGYSNSTVNVAFSACNQFLSFIDRQEYQFKDRLAADTNLQPELSRSEYQRLLSTARILGDERAYFLIKTFVCTGIYVHELPLMTVENIAAGRFVAVYQGNRRTVRIPPCLQQEFLDYARRRGIRSGQIFITRRNKPLHRSRVTNLITHLCEEAQVPKEKGNPRCLRKLYLSTRANIERSFELLVEQAMDRQLEQEQLAVGWKTG